MIYTPAGFKVFGRFSEIEDDNGKSHVVRSILEIMTEETPLDSLPDAVFIMMNPGSCEIDNTKPECDLPETCSHVARPDNTQKRIIDLMTLKGWGHARILNLSDLRNASSREFFALLDGFRTPIHSIFQDSRRKELQKALKAKKSAVVIKAWGVAKELQSLAEMALECLPTTALGLRHPKNVVGYYHPLPRTQKQQKQWMADIQAQLEI